MANCNGGLKLTLPASPTAAVGQKASALAKRCYSTVLHFKTRYSYWDRRIEIKPWLMENGIADLTLIGFRKRKISEALEMHCCTLLWLQEHIDISALCNKVKRDTTVKNIQTLIHSNMH